MLRQLYIENVAVIEKTRVDFADGFHVLTGETGAGKSILIDAINAVLGVRTSRDIVRTGTEKAFVSALFQDVAQPVADVLLSLGYECEDSSLLLSREITADGKTNCRINGKPATVAILREVGMMLINIHGQHDNQSLLIPEKHIQFIDGFGRLESYVERYTHKYKEYISILRQIEVLSADDADKERKMDLLKYQINEIHSANLTLGEEEELLHLRKIYRNSETILENLNTAHLCLAGDENSEYAGGCVTALGEAARAVREAAKFNGDMENIAQRLEEMSYEAQEYLGEIGETLQSMEFNPSDVDRVETRLDIIYRLKKKYGSDIGEILAFCENAKEELGGIERSDDTLAELQQQIIGVKADLISLGEELSQKRIKSAELFSKSVRDELSFLDMPSVQFSASHEKREPGPGGMDEMEFLISTNPGEPPKPISKIASGGELARIMLSIKNVLSGKDDIPTMIFDEIDAGISGRAAQKVGQKLKQVAQGRQVICVTHLAQIAALADCHMLIEKSVANGRTSTQVMELSMEQRRGELARIIGGANITDITLQAAQEMLEGNPA